MTPTGGWEVAMGTPSRCRVRYHKWVKTRNPDGDDYRRCARCGVERLDYEGPIVGGFSGSGSV
jgi:hypothetical protein